MESLLQELSVLQETRQGLFARVQRSYDQFQQLTVDNVEQAQLRYDRMLMLEAEFETVQSKIIKLNAKLVLPNKPLEVEAVQSSFETVFYKAHGRFVDLKKQLEASRVGERPVNTSSMSANSLPKIDLPVFSGDISKWTEYYSLFTSLIHENDSLNDLQKFHYLRVTLSEAALAVISGFALIKQNYPLALKALISRYENPRWLANVSMQQLFDLPPLKSATHSELQQFVRVHQTTLDSLKAIENLDLGNFVLFSLALTKLDSQTRKAFEGKIASDKTVPTYESLLAYVTQAAQVLEMCASNRNKPQVNVLPSPKRMSSLLMTTTQSGKANNSDRKSGGQSSLAKSTACVLCKDAHSLYRCPLFGNQTVDEKYDTLRRLNRCFNCMGAHVRSQCTSQRACSICNSQRHHSLLHATEPMPSLVSVADALPSQDNSPAPLKSLACQITNRASPQTVLLGTVRALIRDSHGNWQPFRAVIDSGSQISAVTHSLIQRLGLHVNPSRSELSGIGQASARVYGTVQCNIVPRFAPAKSLSVQAYVLSAISSQLPTSSVPLEVFRSYRGLALADDRFHVPDQVDFLIGADLYLDILAKSGAMVIGGNRSAINTVFGWVIMGPSGYSKSQAPPPLSLLTCKVSPLETALRSFWEIEEVARPPPKDPDDLISEKHFLATHSRDSSGRYQVALPFKPSCSPLGSNRGAVFRNYLSLERRMQRIPEQYSAYQAFMQDYVQSKHMQVAPSPAKYVIPHHCVHKITSSSTKLRVVFNASFPDDQGVSLNQLLLSGPKLQSDLPVILTTFRTHTVAICADIRQMYRQILVEPTDRAHQHIFWRPIPDSPVVEYELNTVTYGLTPSAFLAQRVLHQIVHDEGADFPLAARAITSHTYIDDIVSGASDLTQARELQSQLQALLARGGFELRKWASNVPSVLNSLPETHLEHPLVFSNDDQGIKILGLLWDPHSDEFSFHTLPFEGEVTKRTALSYIARIFDPLGFLAPIVSWMKMFLQQLWLSHVQWDDPLPPLLAQDWRDAVSDISVLSGFRVPRPFLAPHGIHRLVGFCDASEKGYAAVIYLHTTTGATSLVSLMRAKSKVSPLKPLTIPKLELSAALLLCRLLQGTLPALGTLSIESVTYYTDSTIVLAWLATPPHRLKTFVANRVVDILEISAPTDWAHVASQDNPADCASRGLLPHELLDHPLWLAGPPFMRKALDLWPRSMPAGEQPSNQLPEATPVPVVLAVAVTENPVLLVFRNFSTLLRAQRVFGYVFRFTRILLAKRSKTPVPAGPLQPVELQDALDLFVKVTQQHYYAPELRQLAQNGHVTSKLASLKPFVDYSGFLRVGGRLRYSSLPEPARHPLLLPKRAHLSMLLCDAFHKTSLHSGPRTVQALLQQRYWIVSVRGLLRQRIHQCLTCHKFRAKPLQPTMADLPVPRVQASRAFSHVGTDFAGPFPVKTSTRRNAAHSKGYLCLFVCMSTKAVHLEMVSDLSTSAFLASLDRLVARRGLPSDIYSDNGRNFVGAARQLHEICNFLAQSTTAISDSLSSRAIKWHFNPPYAPNFGGVWEAGVKSVKTLLYRLIADSAHTHEEYATLFCRIEAVLNSRPLCALAAEPEESSSYLSPGHFLIGSPLLAPPEPLEDDRPSRLSRWQRVRQLHQAFWSRWHSEYLHTLMQRGKWIRGCPNLKVGDVVYFQDRSSSPLSWPIGRVTDLSPGSDGVVRVVTIRTTHGTFQRPVNKLVALPPV
jgi:hypothetical protein